jgi:hypothetical protein
VLRNGNGNSRKKQSRMAANCADIILCAAIVFRGKRGAGCYKQYGGKRKMKEGIQSFLYAGGKWACLALCIVKIAEEVEGTAYEWHEAVQKVLAGIDKGFIYYNFNDSADSKNFDVLDNAGFLSFLLGGGRTVSVCFITDPKMIKNWQAKDNEYTVQRWRRNDGLGMETVHFTRPLWNSLIYSRTVAEGYIDRLTIFTVV